MPQLLRTGEPLPAPGPLEISPKHIAIVKDALYAVCNEPIGTAYNSRIFLSDRAMAGKTGTSQVRNILTAERISGIIETETLPWRLRDHGIFVGYAPAHAPRYAVTVVAEHGGGGSHAAAPVARDLLLFAFSSSNKQAQAESAP